MVIMPPMQRLAEVMFWKSLIMALWAGFTETRPDRALLLRFQREWDKRRAKQPRLLNAPEKFSG